MSKSDEGSLPYTALIWDLGGVLSQISLRCYASAIGIGSFLRYLLFHGQFPQAITVRSFEVLMRIPVPPGIPHEPEARIPGGLPMPPIMEAYQSGFLKREDILPVAHTTIKELHKENYFKDLSEQELISRVVDELFNPKTLARCHYFVPKGVELIHVLASQHGPGGVRRYGLYVLSNWDPISFSMISQESQGFLSLFDAIVTSGATGLLKPSEAIFDYLIKTDHLDKASCIFIDDQEENILAAESYGIGKAILFKNFAQLEKDLVACGVHLR